MAMKNKDIAEGIGVIALVLSLLFVGYEIRQNSQVARNEAYQNYQSSTREVALTIATDPILAPLIVKVDNGSGLDELTEEELLRISAYFLSGLRTWEELFRAVDSGVVPTDRLRVIGNGGTAGFGSELFEALWDAALRDAVSEDFSDYFEKLDWFRKG